MGTLFLRGWWTAGTRSSLMTLMSWWAGLVWDCFWSCIFVCVSRRFHSACFIWYILTWILCKQIMHPCAFWSALKRHELMCVLHVQRRRLPELHQNKESVGELWLGLLRFYTEEFDFKEHVISIRQRKRLTTFEKQWTSKCIAIEGLKLIVGTQSICMFLWYYILIL